jgi:hypothetical protein
MVPITYGCGFGNCCPDEAIVVKGRLCRSLWILQQNGGQQDADLVGAAVRRIIKRMEASKLSAAQVPSVFRMQTARLPDARQRVRLSECVRYDSSAEAGSANQAEGASAPYAVRGILESTGQPGLHHCA